MGVFQITSKSAVITPAVTDELLIQQSAITKKTVQVFNSMNGFDAATGMAGANLLVGSQSGNVKITLTQLIAYMNTLKWSLVGSGLDIANTRLPALCKLSETQVAFVDDSNYKLRVYEFNGSTWSLVGSELSVDTRFPAICALNSTDIAFIDGANDKLRCYRFNGSTWSLVGSGLDIANTGFPALCTLSETQVAFVDDNNDKLRVYEFNGSTWRQFSLNLDITGANFPAICALNSTDIAFIDGANDQLRCYRYG
jgi:hypothetical protein